MSRAQEGSTRATADSQNATDYSDAQGSYADAKNSIGNYNSQLAKFVSSNPYSAGGDYDKSINTGLANVSDAGSDSLAGNLQSQALRTGQNSAADAATAASAAQQNTRNLSSDLAGAQQTRIGDEAAYNQQGLAASAEPISANSSLYGTASGAAGTALNTAAGVSKTPSFWDTVGNTFGQGLGSSIFNAGQGS